MRDWIPFFSKLVWPLFLGALLLSYQGPIRALADQVIAAVSQGRSVAFGDWLQIGEATDIAALSMGPGDGAAGDMTVSVGDVAGFAEVTTKGSAAQLGDLRRRIEQGELDRIDVLMVPDDRRYSLRLLGRYINSLGIRFVVFREGARFAGWIDSGLFLSQLPSAPDGDDLYLGYGDLRELVSGVRGLTVEPGASLLDVLALMDEAEAEHVAVVDEAGQFRFIASRSAITSKLVTKALLAQRAGAQD